MGTIKTNIFAWVLDLDWRTLAAVWGAGLSTWIAFKDRRPKLNIEAAISARRIYEPRRDLEQYLELVVRNWGRNPHFIEKWVYVHRSQGKEITTPVRVDLTIQPLVVERIVCTKGREQFNDIMSERLRELYVINARGRKWEVSWENIREIKTRTGLRSDKHTSRPGDP